MEKRDEIGEAHDLVVKAIARLPEPGYPYLVGDMLRIKMVRQLLDEALANLRVLCGKEI